MPSFLPPDDSTTIDLATQLSPKAQRLLRLAGGLGGEKGEGGAMTEAKFREALAADVCGTQVFAQGMKLFLTVGNGVDMWDMDILYTMP